MSLPQAIVQQFSAGAPTYDILVTRGASWELPLQLTSCDDQPIELGQDTSVTSVINDLQGQPLQAMTVADLDVENGSFLLRLSAAATAGLPAPTTGKRTQKGVIGRWDARLTDGETVIIIKGEVLAVDPQTPGGGA